MQGRSHSTIPKGSSRSIPKGSRTFIPKGLQPLAGGRAANPRTSSYSSLHYHIVFSTKHRTNFINRTWEERLHEYLGGIAKTLGGYPQGIGGIEDHVHLLIGLKPTHRISDFMRELKKESSVWIHDKIGQNEFAWQDGYAIFSISATARPNVKSYIANQREHHRVKSFTEELIEMLEKAGVEYDPKYLE